MKNELNFQHIPRELTQVRERIAVAVKQCQRLPGDVQLLAVSKTFPVSAVLAAVACGQYAFGENYVQEAVEKITQLRQMLPEHPIEWHCIGPVQSRKTALVAAHFDWLHSLDRLDIAQRLSRQRSSQAVPLQVCIQVNMDGGVNKSGVAPHEVLDFALAVKTLPQLQLRGLMSIPEPSSHPQEMLAVHKQTRDLFDRLKDALDLPSWDTLSMGMSDDLEQAIAAGSTMVRVGSAIFGKRTTAQHCPDSVPNTLG